MGFDASLRRLSRLIANIASRASIRRVDDDGRIQRVQIDALDGETRSGVDRLQQYGFTSTPLPGAEGLAIFIGGVRDHAVLVAADDGRYRPTDLDPGEVMIYTDQGDSIRIHRGGTIEITASSKVKISAPAVELGAGTSHVSVARVGDPVAAGAVMATWITKVTGAVNLVIPGFITPPEVPSTLGAISSGSAAVKST